ncbi:MAG: nickel-dependent lactate racemase [Candidatus Nezhaarchaeota archaeon]|nr:nickel-dependent lactate racemase [Candidatus Nezhaarchaeota archaeon]
MAYRLRYGDGFLGFNLPRRLKPSLVIAQERRPGVSARKAVAKALTSPVDGVELRSLVRPSAKAVLIVDDTTRPTPVADVADLVLEQLRGIGELNVVMALGLHPPPSRRGLEAKLGRKLIEKVVLHNPRENLAYLGRTSNGTDVYINRLVAEADLRVAIGTITPHPFAGFSGGPKILLPGVAGEETIRSNHRLLRRPGATLASIDNNPVYQDEAYVASKLPTYVVNLVPSLGGGYIEAVAGEALEAHRVGASIFVKNNLYIIEQPVDVAITSSHPFEVNLYQSWKAVFAVASAVEPNGFIILVTPAREGVPREKLEIANRYGLALRSLDELEGLIDELPDLVFGLVYLKLREVLGERQLIVVSPGASKEEVERLGFSHATSIEEALKQIGVEEGEALINTAGAEVVVKLRGQAS